MMNRDEHLQWCKDRALEYVKMKDLKSAVDLMVGLANHEETIRYSDHFLRIGILSASQNDINGVIKFIEEFN